MNDERRAYFQFLRFLARCGGTTAAAERLETSLVDVVLWETGRLPIPPAIQQTVEATLAAPAEAVDQS
jgi:hypothetical protein